MHTPVHAAARLDRLPIGPFHRRVLRLVGAGMFFDSFDNAMMASVLAALVGNGWSTMSLNASFISATFLGLAIGAATAGLVGDHFGRRFAYQFNLLIFGGACLAASLAPPMTWLIAIRAVMGIGLGAEFVVGYGMISEFVPPARRGQFIALLNLISSSGVFAVSLTSLVAIPLLGWRAMFLIGGVGALWVWWLRHKLPESPRWLEHIGRSEEAEAVLQAIEREAAQVEAGRGRVLPAPVIVPIDAPMRVPIRVLFTRPVIRRTLLSIAVNVTCLVGSYSITAWMPSFFVRQGLSVTRSLGFFTAMTAGTIAGPLLGVFLADRIGRRRGLMATGLACGAIGAVYRAGADHVLRVSAGLDDVAVPGVGPGRLHAGTVPYCVSIPRQRAGADGRPRRADRDAIWRAAAVRQLRHCQRGGGRRDDVRHAGGHHCHRRHRNQPEVAGSSRTWRDRSAGDVRARAGRRIAFEIFLPQEATDAQHPARSHLGPARDQGLWRRARADPY
jgi:putative MFS transporter